MQGTYHKTSNYQNGTFFNCTDEPTDAVTLSMLRKVPCSECGETKNLCYFYDGFIDHISNCIPFRDPIPVEVLSNFSAVGNLRKVLEEGFEIEWDGICNTCGDVGILMKKGRFMKRLVFVVMESIHTTALMVIYFIVYTHIMHLVYFHFFCTIL